MRIGKLLCAAIVIGSAVTASHAAITANNSIDLSLPGLTQNNWAVDTDSDFLQAVLLVELTAGKVHDPITALGFTFDGNLVSPGSGDTFFTANGNTSTSLCGGAGDLGDIGAPNPFFSISLTAISACWLSPGADTDDIGTGLPIGRFSFTDDAVGVWQLLVINAGGDQPVFTGVVINGEMVPEPATLGLLSLGCLALLRRRR